jgi:hypothetical protein
MAATPLTRNRAPIAPARMKRRDPSAHANPFYGFGYNPACPSILSVAHDESDGGRLFIITDRPCVLLSAALPLQIEGRSILDAVTILPIKFRVAMSDAVPQGAAWQWMGNNSQLYDPITGNGINAAAGYCADIPGPYTPPPPPVYANIVTQTASGATCTLTFDQPIVLSGAPVDDAILFDGAAATGVVNIDAYTLGFDVPFASEGSTWSIVRQPAWITTMLTVPQSGAF